ncbi:XkdX family protein [Enterocloster citroniae]|nr:XkdX family protein [Enterocloster citroniae]MCB7067868.1 XkdX family protein [Enterocloster citroniae]
MDVKGLAVKYYPRLWDISRLKALVAAGKLSEADYQEITGEVYVVEQG